MPPVNRLYTELRGRGLEVLLVNFREDAAHDLQPPLDFVTVHLRVEARGEVLVEALERFPMPSALKTVCALRGVPLGNAVRAPLRALDEAERSELQGVLRGLLEAVPA